MTVRRILEFTTGSVENANAKNTLRSALVGSTVYTKGRESVTREKEHMDLQRQE